MFYGYDTAASAEEAAYIVAYATGVPAEDNVPGIITFGTHTSGAADGDLKIRFNDGTVKTIVVDT